MVMMVLVLTLVWGGFAASLLAAMRREGRRTRPPEGEEGRRDGMPARPGAGG